MAERVLEAMATFQRDGSNWTFKSIICLEIHTVAYEPLKGNSYIPLPLKLAQKKAIINMQNEDNKCFTWSVLRALNPKEENAVRIDKEYGERGRSTDFCKHAGGGRQEHLQEIWQTKEDDIWNKGEGRV